MKGQLDDITDFLFMLDKLKTVQRQTYINGGERRENSAEHSWHLAVACWNFAELLSDNYDVLKLIKLALVHDLGEMEAGDTFLYSKDRHDAHIKERQCVEKLANHTGNKVTKLLELWDEQEHGNSKETKLLKAVDRLLPFLHNMTSEGRAWRKNKIRKSQVLKMHGFIEDEFPELFAWVKCKVDYAVEQAWLINE